MGGAGGLLGARSTAATAVGEGEPTQASSGVQERAGGGDGGSLGSKAAGFPPDDGQGMAKSKARLREWWSSGPHVAGRLSGTRPISGHAGRPGSLAAPHRGELRGSRQRGPRHPGQVGVGRGIGNLGGNSKTGIELLSGPRMTRVSSKTPGALEVTFSPQSLSLRCSRVFRGAANGRGRSVRSEVISVNRQSMPGKQC